MKRVMLMSILLVLVTLMSSCATGSKSRVEFVQGENQIDVMIDGVLFTSYRYDATELTKPILWPVNTPDGTLMKILVPFLLFCCGSMKTMNPCWKKKEPWFFAPVKITVVSI